MAARGSYSRRVSSTVPTPHKIADCNLRGVRTQVQYREREIMIGIIRRVVGKLRKTSTEECAEISCGNTTITHIRSKNYRTRKNGERLTQTEVDLMSQNADEMLRCPDCDGRMAGGPEKNGIRNVACEQCYSEFNLHGFGLVIRISDKGPRDLGDRAKHYNLPEKRETT